MNDDKILCDYCKKPVKKQVDCWPTWFGKYRNAKRIEAICKDCLPNNREKWNKKEN